MNYQTILFQKEGPVATITLNRPQKFNPVNTQTRDELLHALGETSMDESIKVLILTGAGGVFSAGGDLQSEMFQPKPVIGDRNQAATFGEVTLAIRNLPKPVIAAVDGIAVGIGFHFAIACDILIASERARFGEGFVNIGIHPDGGGTYLLPRRIGIGRACEMVFTGRIIDAQEADKIGLVNRVVPVDQLESTVKELAMSLAKGPSIAIGLSKISLYQGQHTNLEIALEAEARAQAICFHTQDCKEGVTAFLEKRKPTFKGI